MKYILLGLISLLIASCGQVNDNLAVTITPNSCQSISDVHFFTAVAALICYDKNGNPVQPANSSVQVGTPANLVGSTASAVAPIGMAAVQSMPKASVNISQGAK